MESRTDSLEFKKNRFPNNSKRPPVAPFRPVVVPKPTKQPSSAKNKAKKNFSYTVKTENLAVSPDEQALLNATIQKEISEKFMNQKRLKGLFNKVQEKHQQDSAKKAQHQEVPDNTPVNPRKMKGKSKGPASQTPKVPRTPTFSRELNSAENNNNKSSTSERRSPDKKGRRSSGVRLSLNKAHESTHLFLKEENPEGGYFNKTSFLHSPKRNLSRDPVGSKSLLNRSDSGKSLSNRSFDSENEGFRDRFLTVKEMYSSKKYQQIQEAKKMYSSSSQSSLNKETHKSQGSQRSIHCLSEESEKQE